MKRLVVVMCVLLLAALSAQAYVEAPHTLGRVVHESTHIVLMEVTKINKEKNLIIYKKVKDLKGKHDKDEIKHNIGTRGFHAREWQNVMKWAEVGKKAIFFHNGQASLTCIGTYWYQCYQESEWWGMTHGEPFMLRTYCGEIDKLVEAVNDIKAGKEVIVPCMADGKPDSLHLRKGKMQTMKASLKRQDYNPKRDFVAWGTDTEPTVKTVALIAEGALGWRYLAEAPGKPLGQRWIEPKFLDNTWAKGRAPLGYGDEDIAKRKGTTVKEVGASFLFRRDFEVPEHLFQEKGIIFRLSVASRNSATVWINGKVADQDPEEEHSQAYWNREVDLDPSRLKAGRNNIAVHVKNKVNSPGLYFDLDLTANIPLPKKAAEPKKTTP